jgi:catechol 2,3-dioxygenase-like lactoylglutathione lyase family enzyme
MNIYGIEHVQLAMPKGRESEAIEFYEGVLGLTNVPKPDHLAIRGGCWFESGSVKIHLGVSEAFVPATKAHPALLVHSLPDLVAHLAEHSIEVSVDQPLEGFDRCYAHDPFGNRIEFMQSIPSSSD